MAQSPSFGIPREDREKLQHLSDLLHLFNHRNRNQHRRSTWWRHFSTFRRQLNRLMTELTSLNEVPSTHLARTKKKARDAEVATNIAKRLAFWRDVEVAKWRHAFSQLVADRQFASLGLVLTAALSQVCQIVGLTAHFEDMAQNELEVLNSDMSREDGIVNPPVKELHVAEQEDLGEVVARETIEQVGKDLEAAVTTPAIEGKAVRTGIEMAIKSKTLSPAAASKPPKKKRKKGNAIDDLFSGLE